MLARWCTRALTFLERPIRLIAIVSGLTLMAIAGLTVTDVALRYLFDSPIFGAQDIAELALAVVVFLAAPYCGRTDGHVAVDVVVEWLSPRITRWTDAGVKAIGSAVFVALAWRCWLSGLDAGEYGEATNLLGIAHQPFYVVIAGGALLYALILALEALVLAFGGKPERMTS